MYFSKFPESSFINKDRITSIFRLDAFDMEINYQQQPIMRFVDFLTNQIIFFLMDSSSLHKFDGLKVSPFMYNDIIKTEK